MLSRFLLLILLLTPCCAEQLQTPVAGVYGTTGLKINGTLSQNVQVSTSLFIDSDVTKYNNDPDLLTKLVTTPSFSTLSSIKFDDKTTAISAMFSKGVGDTLIEKDSRITELKLANTISNNITLWSNYLNRNIHNITITTRSSGVNIGLNGSQLNISTTNSGTTTTNRIAWNIVSDNIQLNISKTKISGPNSSTVSQLTTTITPTTNIVIDAAISKTETNNTVSNSTVVKGSAVIDDVKVSTSYNNSSGGVVKDVVIKTVDNTLSLSGSISNKANNNTRTAAIEYTPTKEIRVTGNLIDQKTSVGTKSSIGGTIIAKVGNDVSVSGVFINRDSDYLTGLRDTREFKVSFIPYRKSVILLKIGDNPLSNGSMSNSYKSIAIKATINSIPISIDYLVNNLQIGTESTTIGIGLLFKNCNIRYLKSEAKSIYSITTTKKVVSKIVVDIGVTITHSRNTDFVVHGKLKTNL